SVIDFVEPNTSGQRVTEAKTNGDDELIGLLKDFVQDSVSQVKPDKKLIEKETFEYGEVSVFKFEGDIDRHIDIKFDTFDLDAYINPWQILQALTLAKAKDLWNLERLETIGDSFIKMASSLYL